MGMSASPNPLSELLDQKGVLVADGGMGTSLFAAGLRPGETPERWNVERPEAVIAVHQGFIGAGADIILTNTFGGARTRLDLDGLGDRVAGLNAAGVAAAREASAGSSVIVAGSVGPTGALFEPLGPMTHDEAVEIFAEQMEALAAAGTDLLWIETLSSVEELAAAVAAAEQTGLPFVTTMSFDTNGSTMMGVAPTALAEWWKARRYAEPEPEVADGEERKGIPAQRQRSTQRRAISYPIAIGANCGVGPADAVLAAHQINAAGAEVAVVAKGNCGIPEVIDGQLWYPASSDDMSAYAELALDAGVSIIGACCGSTPEHIAQIRRVVDTYQPAESLDADEVEHRLGKVDRPADRTKRRSRRRSARAVTSVD